MKTEAEIRAKIAEYQEAVSKPPDTPIEETEWTTAMGFLSALEWVLEA